MADFICPVCALPLELYDGVYRCDNNHCFDKSKYGYVNLLRSNSSSAKRHGDDRLMIRARRDFLSKGYYSFLLDGLCDICAEYAPANALLIDAGCGECYYSSSILGVFPSYSAAGADISKDGLTRQTTGWFLMPSIPPMPPNAPAAEQQRLSIRAAMSADTAETR